MPLHFDMQTIFYEFAFIPILMDNLMNIGTSSFPVRHLYTKTAPKHQALHIPFHALCVLQAVPTVSSPFPGLDKPTSFLLEPKKHPVSNGCLVISNHFPSKGLKIIQLKQPSRPGCFRVPGFSQANGLYVQRSCSTESPAILLRFPLT